MEKRTVQRWGFLFLSLVLLIAAGSWEPTIYGNDAASIKRYLYQEREWRDHIRILAVEDYGEDRFAVFQMETKRPDDRFVVRFRKNEEGNYEAYLNSRRMYGPHPVRGVYTQPLEGYSGDREVCYAIWNESEKLAEIHFRLDYGPEEAVSISAPPSLTIWRFTGGTTGWHLESDYFDAAGNEL